MHMELRDKKNSHYQCCICLVYDLLPSSPVLAQSLHHITSHHIISHHITSHHITIYHQTYLTWFDISKMLSYNLLLLQLQYVVAPNLFICKIIMDRHKQCNAMQCNNILIPTILYSSIFASGATLHYTTLHTHNKYRM